MAGEAETSTYSHTTLLAVFFEAGTSFERLDSVVELLDRLDCCTAWEDRLVWGPISRQIGVAART